METREDLTVIVLFALLVAALIAVVAGFAVFDGILTVPVGWAVMGTTFVVVGPLLVGAALIGYLLGWWGDRGGRGRNRR